MNTTEASNKPGPMEIDLLLLKLADAGILLVEPTKSSENHGGDVSKIVKEIQGMFQEEISLRHPQTVVQFHRYCLDILSDTFLNRENAVESVEFIMIASMVAGYATAYLTLDSGRKPIENAAFDREIKKLFTKEDFERFTLFIKDVLVGFREQCEECIKFMKEFPTHEEPQLKAGMKLLEMLRKGETGKQNEAVTMELINECMLGNHGQYNLVGMQARESIGMLRPSKEMPATILRIMNVLDVLHYGGYLNFAGHLSVEHRTDPNYIDFKKVYV